MAHQMRLPTLLLFVLLLVLCLPAGRALSERAISGALLPASETLTWGVAQTSLPPQSGQYGECAPAPSSASVTAQAITVSVDYVGPLINTVQATAEEEVTETRTEVVVALDAGLAVGQQFPPGPLQLGSVLTYTLAVTNTGTVDLHAMIIDILPGHVSPSGVWAWPPVTLVPGQVWTQTLAVTIDLNYSGPLTNTLQIMTEEGVTETSTATVFTVERWWIHLPLVARMLH